MDLTAERRGRIDGALDDLRSTTTIVGASAEEFDLEHLRPKITRVISAMVALIRELPSQDATVRDAIDLMSFQLKRLQGSAEVDVSVRLKDSLRAAITVLQALSKEQRIPGFERWLTTADSDVKAIKEDAFGFQPGVAEVAIKSVTDAFTVIATWPRTCG
jgi:hypothetical protein